MLKCVLLTLATAMGTAAAAQSAAVVYCQQKIVDTGRYQAGFGTIELSGPPLVFDTWSAEHSVMIMTFPDRTFVLTTENVNPSALGDYIATTIEHRERGYEAFGVITDNTDGNRLGLIQPFSIEGAPYCFGSALRLNNG